MDQQIIPATLADLSYILALAKKKSEMLGFIPACRYESVIDGPDHASLLVAVQNGDPAGFIYATHGRFGQSKIQQVVVQDDALRVQLGRAMVDAIVQPNDHTLSCRCAADLDSNAFWQALGFVPGRVKLGGQRRGRLIVPYIKTTGGLFT